MKSITAYPIAAIVVGLILAHYFKVIDQMTAISIGVAVGLIGAGIGACHSFKKQ